MIARKRPLVASLLMCAAGLTLGAASFAADPPAMRPLPGSTLPVAPPANLRPPSALPEATRPLAAPTTAAIKRAPFNAVRMYQVSIAPIDPKSSYLPSVDLRPQISQLGLAVRSQGHRGTCSVFAVTFLIEYMNAKFVGGRPTVPPNDLSEEYLNTASNVASGEASDGDFFDRIDAGYQKFGIVGEKDMPYQGTYTPTLTLPQHLIDLGRSVLRLKPSFIKPWDNGRGATRAQLGQVLSTLDQGIPVAGGFWWPVQHAWSRRNIGGVEVMATPELNEKGINLKDGHSVALVGYRRDLNFPGGGYFVFRNSWGRLWGDHGYGYMPFEYVLRFANDLVAYQR